MLGLAHNVNVLVPYDPEWPRLFELERLRLATALGGLPEGVEHYGSTAVPGLAAKPILDILVGVRPFTRWKRCHDPLLALGYDYAANAGVPGHHIFGRGRDRTERTHLLHVVDFDGPSWGPNLAFRDALRADETLRAAYIAEKQHAIEAAQDSRPAYNLAKGAFIADAKSRLVD